MHVLGTSALLNLTITKNMLIYFLMFMKLLCKSKFRVNTNLYKSKK